MGSREFVIYIPNYNGGGFLSRFSIPGGMDCVVMDNASTDDSIKICKKRNIRVVQNSRNVSRVENWSRCVKHFLESEYNWMKWLFVGDDLCENLLEKLESAVQKHPEARYIIGSHFVNKGKRNQLWTSVYGKEEEVLLTPEKARLDILENGSIFGAPLSLCLHKEAVTSGYNFGDFSWCADAYFGYCMSRKCMGVYLDMKLGVMNLNQRNYYQRYYLDFSSNVELYHMLCRIAKDKLAEDGDEAYFERCLERWKRKFELQTVKNVVAKANSIGDFGKIILYEGAGVRRNLLRRLGKL